MSVHPSTHHGLGFPGTPLPGDGHGELFHRILRGVVFLLVLVAMFLLL